MRRLLVAGAAALAVLVSFPGCATLEKAPATASLVTQYATAKVIEAGKTPEERTARAARIKAIASDARSWLDGDAVTISFLQQAAQDRLAKLDLSPADLLLAQGLVQVIVDELQAKVGAGVLSEATKLTVSQVLGWVVSATELYAAHLAMPEDEAVIRAATLRRLEEGLAEQVAIRRPAPSLVGT